MREQRLLVVAAFAVLATVSCGPSLGQWHRTDTGEQAKRDEVRRDWNACADVVDVKYGGFGFTRSAGASTPAWIETRDCMVRKGYYHTTPHLDGTATRYPPAQGGSFTDADPLP